MSNKMSNVHSNTAQFLIKLRKRIRLSDYLFLVRSRKLCIVYRRDEKKTLKQAHYCYKSKKFTCAVGTYLCKHFYFMC